jgi:hypothetical protein
LILSRSIYRSLLLISRSLWVQRLYKRALLPDVRVCSFVGGGSLDSLVTNELWNAREREREKDRGSRQCSKVSALVYAV